MVQMNTNFHPPIDRQSEDTGPVRKTLIENKQVLGYLTQTYCTYCTNDFLGVIYDVSQIEDTCVSFSRDKHIAFDIVNMSEIQDICVSKNWDTHLPTVDS